MDGTEKLCNALYGRGSTAIDWVGGSDARMLHDAAERIKALEERNVELGMQSYKWMAAHDAANAGKDYEFPAPADVPDSIKRIHQLEGAMANLQERHSAALDIINNARRTLYAVCKTGE